MLPVSHTFSKEERLCGKTSIAALVSRGKWGGTSHIKYCVLHRGDNGVNRVMVSVPKKYFKRAVKRNLLKRRMREAYRTRKELLAAKGIDIMFSWSHQEIADYGTICTEMESILNRLSR